jgi:two-component system cell cycle sensor histidine kinase/response regulator CckA
MMGQRLNVLVLEDNPADAELMVLELKRAGFEFDSRRVESESEYLKELSKKLDLILADYSLPQYNALRALLRLRETGEDIPFIIVTGSVGEEAAVECMKQGATDYLLKDRLARLGEAVKRALEQKRMRDERKKIEGQLQQSQKLETVGQLAGGIAHDFNNLLTVINGCCDLLLQDMVQTDPRRSLVMEIRAAREHASELTHQLLAFSRRQQVQPLRLNLNSVVQDTEKMLRRLISKQVNLTSHLAADLGFIRADPSHIQQVLMNLVVNARDAMPEGGSLFIETSNVDIQASDAQLHHSMTPGPYVRLIVRDTGTGMDAETLSHLFEPFFTTKEKDKGTGLGLATVYGIVKQNQGHIEVSSELGQGSTFTIYLPRLDDAESRKTGEEKVGHFASPTGNEAILVAVEEETMRRLILHVLEGHGYHVLEARRGKDALEVVERYTRPIDILVSDLALPDMSAQSLLQHLLQSNPSMKALFISAFAGVAVLPELAHCSRVLKKPFSLETLLQKVRETLDLAVVHGR